MPGGIDPIKSQNTARSDQARNRDPRIPSKLSGPCQKTASNDAEAGGKGSPQNVEEPCKSIGSSDRNFLASVLVRRLPSEGS